MLPLDIRAWAGSGGSSPMGCRHGYDCTDFRNPPPSVLPPISQPRLGTESRKLAGSASSDQSTGTTSVSCPAAVVGPVPSRALPQQCAGQTRESSRLTAKPGLGHCPPGLPPPAAPCTTQGPSHPRAFAQALFRTLAKAVPPSPLAHFGFLPRAPLYFGHPPPSEHVLSCAGEGCEYLSGAGSVGDGTL